MRSKLTKWLIRWLVFLFIFPVFGQSEATEAQRLSWSDARQYVMIHNRELKLAREAIETAEAQLSLERAGFGPSLQATASQSLTHGPLDPDHKSSQSVDVGLSLRQEIFRGFATQSQVTRAKAELGKVESDYQLRVLEVVSELKKAFAELSFQNEARDLAIDIKKRRAESLDLVLLRYEGGIENQGSVALSKVYLQQAELDLIDAESEVQLAQSRLLQILGQETWNYAGIEKLKPQPAPALSLDLEPFIQQHPRLQSARADQQIAEAGLRESRAGYWPVIDLSGQYGRSDRQFFPREKPQWNITLGVTLNLLNSGRDFYATEAAVHRSVSAGLAENKIRSELELDLSSSLKKLHATMRRATLIEDLLKAAQLRSDISRSKYRNGLASFDEWYLIENELIDNLRSRIDLERNLLLNEADWDKSQGAVK